MDIRDVALKYLAARSRTTREMKDHLKASGFGEEESEKMIEALKKVHYLDDIQYAVDYINYAVSRGRGHVRIKQELSHKGIDSFTLEDAFYRIATENSSDGGEMPSERERALAEAMKIIEGKEINDKIRGKVSRRLISLGYDADTVYYVIGRLMK